MTNTMSDLRREVASRMRNALHGREVDMDETNVQLPHMIGITPIGNSHLPQNEEQTLLDPAHPFWEDYAGEIKTTNAAKRKIESAIRTLRSDDIFRMTYPYGEEASIAYIEVDPMSDENQSQKTECRECGRAVHVSLDFALEHNYYFMKTRLTCSNCSFDETFERMMYPT